MTSAPVADYALRLIAFPGAPNLPVFAALAHGDFDREGLAVTLETTPSSVYQIENLYAGQFDIAATAFDNVVAYREGQGVVDLGDDVDLFAFMGAVRHIATLEIVVKPCQAGSSMSKGRP